MYNEGFRAKVDNFQDAARDFYDCSLLDRVEMEKGWTLYATSHWEQRLAGVTTAFYRIYLPQNPRLKINVYNFSMRLSTREKRATPFTYRT